jgi:dGTPase
MKWPQLLNPNRLGNPGAVAGLEARNQFQRDFDRLVFSTPFRRMHGKTQVFPLPESDITHTRLTHSLETSCVARSLGSIAGGRLNQEDIDRDSLATIVSAAALAHDIGNPPFGHSGEAAIAEYFGDAGKKYIKGLAAAQMADFTAFEGNALGFRLLTRTKPRHSDWPGGLQLTYATLGAFTKYPKGSLPVGRDGRASEKKFGYFQSDSETFRDVATELGLAETPGYGWARHPLAFLVEAADDICYRIIDLEDGYRLGLVPFDATFKLLRAVADLSPYPTDEATIGGLRDRNEQIGYLRAKAINNLVFQVADLFVSRHDAIIAGEFDTPLVELTPACNELATIKSATAELIYPHRPVVAIETAGFRVLGGLLADFLGAIWEHPRSRRGAKILSLVGPEYLTERHDDHYECVMGLTEFVASMTDDFAISSYRVLRGIELPTT